MIGYTGLRRYGALGEPTKRSRVLPVLNCSKCGNPGRIEPALTTTKDGVTSTAYPVTCRHCVETYHVRGKERQRALVTYAPVPKVEEVMPIIISDEDRKMLDRVLALKESQKLTWDRLAANMGRKPTSVSNAVKSPENYLYQGIKDELYKWVERQGQTAESLAPAESPEPEEPGLTPQILSDSLKTAGQECRDLLEECRIYRSLASTFLNKIAEEAVAASLPKIPGARLRAKVTVVVDLLQLEVTDAI